MCILSQDLTHNPASSFAETLESDPALCNNAPPACSIEVDFEAKVLLQSGTLSSIDEFLVGERVLAVDLNAFVLVCVSIKSVVRSSQGRIRIGLQENDVAVFVDTAPDLLSCHIHRLLAVSLLQGLPCDDAGVFLSLGSSLHKARSKLCIPCKFRGTARGCRDGVLCRLCHFPHQELSRTAKRTLIRRSDLCQSNLSLASAMGAEMLVALKTCMEQQSTKCTDLSVESTSGIGSGCSLDDDLTSDVNSVSPQLFLSPDVPVTTRGHQHYVKNTFVHVLSESDSYPVRRAYSAPP